MLAGDGQVAKELDLVTTTQAVTIYLGDDWLGTVQKGSGEMKQTLYKEGPAF